MGPLIDDQPMFLDRPQQTSIARWAVKTAMVMDSITIDPGRPLFFTDAERQLMRDSQTLPVRTLVWLGRYLRIGLTVASGMCYYAPPGGARYPAFLATFVLGSLAIQILTFRAPADYRDRTISLTPAKGAWNELLCTIWPSPMRLYWPPILAFDDKMIPIRSLHARWELGTERKIWQ